MERANTVMRILQDSKVFPFSTSPSSFSLSLTPFDLPFITFSHVQRLFFYPLPHSHPSSFFDSILPKLKQSLSLTLQHFLPLAGNLIWPDDSPNPFILVTPNDGVSLTVAETDSDFNQFSDTHIARELNELRALIPTVQSSGTQVPILALQITKFPNDGFSIGIALHHVISDGKSAIMFLKAWAHTCKQINTSNSLESCDHLSSLPELLTPSFDRSITIFQTPPDFTLHIKSLNSFSFHGVPSNWMHGTFELTRAQIEKLKKRVLDSVENNSSSKQLHLSTFVVAYAYVLVCLNKAKKEESGQRFVIVLTADARGLLEPPIPSNYFGNCLSHTSAFAEGREFTEEVGFLNIAMKISDMILEIRKSGHVVKARKVSEVQEGLLRRIEVFSVADSPKFKFYETDFGWGKPKKIQFVSLEDNNISLIDARDGGGVIEVGVVLPRHLMDTFTSLLMA